ncbi:Cell morphogenesis protein PAG1, partial [Quaeritorhiza haematococci]
MSYQVFLEDIQPYMKSAVDDMRARLVTTSRMDLGRKTTVSHQNAQTAHMKRLERLRMEVTHLLSLVADFADHEVYRKNEALMGGVINYVRETARFLSDPEIQLEWDHQMLRYYFCGFAERFYDHLVTSLPMSVSLPGGGSGNPPSGVETADRYFPFDTRYKLFKLFEQWCGHGQLSGSTRDREAKMMLAVLDQVKDMRERGALTATMEEQRKALEMASLKAMACLCKGPIVNPRNPGIGFDLGALVAWVDSILASPDEKFHPIARQALEALLTFNKSNAQLLEDIVKQ